MKKNEKQKEYSSYEESSFQSRDAYDTSVTDLAKSNFLIGAKYRSSLLENQLTTIVLQKLQQKTEAELRQGELICTIKASEIRELLSANDGSFYDQLRLASQSMTARSIGWNDPEQQRFEYVNVINSAKYENGVLRVRFNPDLRNQIGNLTSNFTILNIGTLLKFRNVYAFRLYEILRSKAYYKKGSKKTSNVFRIEFGLSELKFDLGCINAELDTVRRILDAKTEPDYDKAAEASPEKMFINWADFRKGVLLKAVSEINEKTPDMQITFEPLKSGRGGKVVGVIFYVTLQDKSEDRPAFEGDSQIVESKTLSEDEKMDFYFSIRDIIREKISSSDIRAISEAADYDRARISDAYELMQESDTVITNVTGWMIAAIKKGYSRTAEVPKKGSRAKTKNSFHNFEERDTDYSKLGDLPF